MELGKTIPKGNQASQDRNIINLEFDYSALYHHFLERTLWLSCVV